MMDDEWTSVRSDINLTCREDANVRLHRETAEPTNLCIMDEQVRGSCLRIPKRTIFRLCWKRESGVVVAEGDEDDVPGWWRSIVRVVAGENNDFAKVCLRDWIDERKYRSGNCSDSIVMARLGTRVLNRWRIVNSVVCVLYYTYVCAYNWKISKLICFSFIGLGCINLIVYTRIVLGKN